MPGLLIIAHAPLATALRDVAQHIFAESFCARCLKAFDVTPEMTIEDVEAGAAGALASVANPDVLILTDVGGATPANGALRLAERMGSSGTGPRIKVIAGVNVPMLWRALGHADDAIDRLVDCASSGAGAGVMVLSNTKPQNQAKRVRTHDQNAGEHQQ